MPSQPIINLLRNFWKNPDFIASDSLRELFFVDTYFCTYKNFMLITKVENNPCVWLGIMRDKKTGKTVWLAWIISLVNVDPNDFFFRGHP